MQMIKHYQDSLAQAIIFLSRLSEQEYQYCSSNMSSIGAHVRHILDHFIVIKHCIEQDSAIVNYENRQRGSQVETDKQLAIQSINKLITWLGQLDHTQLDKLISVESQISITETCIVSVPSSINRELMFAASHAVHHYALMKNILSTQIPTHTQASSDHIANFGVAPSTVQFNKSES
ncbi:hypothetical protein [Algibacillus agarilyticus]|uniref:hypothetical protein n=1 Tax=Algibacillus agarilyticus TaxID=2234133 RepID=UPI000DD0955D|nr:hypothetical protein [Algibacillus agarilyticus]